MIDGRLTARGGPAGGDGGFIETSGAANIQPDLAGAYGDQNVTLALTADNDVTINGGITIGPASAADGDSMGVTITAQGGSITNNGTINTSLGAGGDVNLNAGGLLTIAGGITGGQCHPHRWYRHRAHCGWRRHLRRYHLRQGSAQYVVIVQYPIEEEKGSVGSSSLHVKHYPCFIKNPRNHPGPDN